MRRQVLQQSFRQGFLFAITFGLVGCVHVAPYEREDLARPGMDTEREAAEMGFQAHVQDSREGATGGAGSTGGGCGCN
jgi:hypothetical protein